MRASFADSSICHLADLGGGAISLSTGPILFSDHGLIEKITFDVKAGVCKLPVGHLPKIKLDIQFPLLGVVVSSTKVRKLIEIAKGWKEFGDSAPLESAAPSSSSLSIPQTSSTPSSTSSPSPSAESSDLPPEEKQIELNFSLEEARITIAREHKDQSSDHEFSSEPLLLFSLKNTSVYFEKSSYKQNANLVLGSFSVEDSLLPLSVPPEFRYLCTSSSKFHQKLSSSQIQEEGKLVLIEYDGTPSDSPVYDKAEAEHVVKVVTSTLHVNVNRPVIVSVLQLSKEVVDSLAILGPPPSKEGEIQEINQVEKEEGAEKRESLEKIRNQNRKFVKSIVLSSAAEESVSPSPASSSSSTPSIPMLKANAILGSVTLSLNIEEYSGSERNIEHIQNMKQFLFAGLGSSAIDTIIGSNGEIDLKGNVGTIQLKDLREGVCWPNVVAIQESEKLIDFAVKISSSPSIQLPRGLPAAAEEEKLGEKEREKEEEEDSQEEGALVPHQSGGGRGGLVSIGPVQVIEANVQMSSVEVVGKSELLPEVLDFFDIFTEMQKELAVKAAPQMTVAVQQRPSPPQPQQQILIIKLNVKINNCFVVAPLDTSTANSPIVRFDFGRISISNQVFLPRPNGPPTRHSNGPNACKNRRYETPNMFPIS